MKTKKLKLFLIIVLVNFSLFNIYAQNESNWSLVSDQSIVNSSKLQKPSMPSSYKIYKLDLNKLKDELKNVSSIITSNKSQKTVIELPNETGILEHFNVISSEIMDVNLALKYPMIKTYKAQSIENPSAIAKISITNLGFHSMILYTGKSSVFIEPYTKDLKYYIVYNKQSLSDFVSDFSCNTKQPNRISSNLNRNSNILNTNDKKLRTYKLALTCTAEYGNLFSGTLGTDQEKKANILSQMAITINRVNGIYERDLGITLQFVANNDLVICFGDISLDPYTDEYNIQTSITLDTNIGFANYDIGHNFNTVSGGNAGCIGCVCSTETNPNFYTHKGTGMTGSENPVGDPFNVDFVAHEFGHQFGAFHTQSSAFCRSGNGSSEVEPGSASTIMGYAGICPEIVQNNSDDYFAFVNIRDISENVKNGVSSNCPVITTIVNNPPTVNAGRDYVIPKSTPFVLSCIASDPDGDIISYNWEQNDPESPNTVDAPLPTRPAGPNFRSLPSSLSNRRFFPNLNTVLNGQTFNQWEVCPSVSRNLNFSVLARDNNLECGQTASDKMKVKVIENAGPFIITSPNSNITLTSGLNETIAWNVAGTDSNGIDTKFVDILLSTNGGLDFTVLLASQVPNDGSEIITLPNLPGTQNRILIRGYDNIFYDISDSDFTILPSATTFIPSFSGIEGQQTKFICSASNVNFKINVATVNNFSDAINFTVTGLPAGATYLFSPINISSNFEVIMTVNLLSTTDVGFYSILVTATSGATSKVIPFYLSVGLGAINNPIPANNAINQNIILNLSWLPTTNATSYEIELTSDSSFTNLVVDETVNTNTFSITNLTQNTDYFWRILPKNQTCSANFSETYTFKTGILSCNFVPYEGAAVIIPEGIVSTTNSSLQINQSEIIADLNVTLKINHVYINDLTVALISPSGSEIKLFERQCGDGAIPNVDAVFDDSGIVVICGESPGISGTVKPLQNLSSLIGQNINGNWTLKVDDFIDYDGGTVESWGINFCTLTPNLSTNDFNFENFVVYPNPTNNGSINVKFTSNNSSKVDINVIDVRGRSIFNKSYDNKLVFNENIKLDNVSGGLYFINVINEGKRISKKIIISN